MTGGDTVRVMIVDRNVQSRRRLRSALMQIAACELVCEVTDPTSARDSAVRSGAEVVLLSELLPTERDNLVTGLVAGAEVSVFVIDASSSADDVWMTLKNGASGFLLTEHLDEELEHALLSARTGGLSISPPLLKQLTTYLADCLDGRYSGIEVAEIQRRLLPREQETLSRLAAGESTDEMASHMYVASGTVRAYVSRILHKLELRNRGEAVIVAHRSGFFSTKAGQH